ncbi:type II secretion system F family protein [Wenyingzhuangia sp. IMCC45533]
MGSKSVWTKEITLFNSSLNSKSKAAFYTEVAIMLSSGINLLEAIKMGILQLKNKDQTLFNSIIKKLIGGDSLHQALSKYPEIFSAYELTSIKIGEETGSLIEVFSKMGAFFQKKIMQKQNIMNAITYPIIVLVTALFSVGFMLKFVVPMFADVFKQNGVELPVITQQVIKVSNFFQNNFFLILLGLLAVILGYIYLLKNKRFKEVNDNLVLKVPILGNLIYKNNLLTLTESLTLLLASNVPLLFSIQLSEEMLTFLPLKKAISKIEKEMIKGKGIAVVVESEKIFDRKFKSLIQVAEETNNMHYAFNTLSQFYTKELESISKRMATILEPIVIIVLGGIVGLILVAMYLPMFKLSTVIS